jgi:hypothetical protein
MPEAASDRALEIFAKTTGTHDTHYGAALNNRAIILSEQGKTVLALDYLRARIERAARVVCRQPESARAVSRGQSADQGRVDAIASRRSC